MASFDDPRLLDYAGVRDPVRLRRRGAFLAEGRLVLQVLLRAPRFMLRSVLATPATIAWLEAEGVRLPAGVALYGIESTVLESGSGFRFHQGCLAAATVPEPPSLEALVAQVVRAGRPLVLLQGVSNPDNVGAIFRTAAALGAGAVALDKACSSPLYRKAVRTSMGAVLRIPFRHAGETETQIAAAKAGGLRVVALTPSAAAGSIEAEREHGGARALLFGAEGAGLSRAALAAADAHVRIPIDPALDSLNVAAAAAITLYRLGGGS